VVACSGRAGPLPLALVVRRNGVEDVARIVLAMEQHDVAEEVMHFLDRSGHTRVVATAADDRQLQEALRQLEPDAVVGQPSLVADAIRTQAFLAVDTRESVGALMAAIRAGADGFFVWPADRDALSAAAASTRAAPVAPDRRASVIAVHAARGGAGATFVATHLARAFARRGKACVLIDGDPLFGEVSAAVGAPEENSHSIADLVPLGTELASAHLDDTLWTHPEGFRVLLSPPAEDAASVEASHVRRIADVASTATDVVILHLPHAIDAHARAGCETADRILEVLSLDVLSFRSSMRALDLLSPLDLKGKVGFVVNRAARAEITPRDVARVFGCEPLAVIQADRSVARAQDHGRLVGVRGRTGRAFDRLAERLGSVS
jgi:Flp pilus assembly CpaE family ATPase